MKIMRKLATFLILILTLTLFGCKPAGIEITPINDGVAKLSIVSFDGASESVLGLMNLGHAFVVIENNSSEDMIVGKYNLKSGRAVTIGTWSIAEHFGIWYNVENNYIEYCNKYDGRVSLSKEISIDDLNKINTFISTNDRWGVLKNCGYFATNLWNTVAKDGEILNVGYTPKSICSVITNTPNFEKNIVIPVSDEMGYFDSENYISFKLEGEHYEKI